MKLTRKQLFWRWCAGLAFLNGLLYLAFWPTPPEQRAVAPLDAHLVHFKVRSALHTPFIARAQVLLTGPGQAIGPVTLLEQVEDGLIVALGPDLYRRHHLQLAHQEWAALPYVEGMLARQQPTGVRYEIAY